MGYYQFTDTQVWVLALTVALFAVTTAMWIAFYIFRRREKSNVPEDFKAYHIKRHKAILAAVIEGKNDFALQRPALALSDPKLSDFELWLSVSAFQDSDHQTLMESHMAITVNEKK